MLDKQGYTFARTCPRTRARSPTHTHAHARANTLHARTEHCVILITFPRQQRFRERALQLRYTYIHRFSFLSLVVKYCNDSTAGTCPS
jgi:hypothetical protein